VTDFSADDASLERLETQVRARLDALMDGAAALSEFTVDFPLGARKPLTDAQREVAVILNAIAELLHQRALEASAANEPRWEGLADAGTMVHNALGYHSLPQIERAFPEEPQHDS
jgi:hypothetical protein